MLVCRGRLCLDGCLFFGPKVCPGTTSGRNISMDGRYSWLDLASVGFTWTWGFLLFVAVHFADFIYLYEDRRQTLNADFSSFFFCKFIY